MRIGVKPVFPQKTDERLAIGFREFDGQAGWRGGKGNDGDACRQGFLNNLKGSPAGDKQDGVLQGEISFEYMGPYDFVDSIMSADVFLNVDQGSSPIEQCRRMKTSGAFKTVLFSFQGLK